MRRLSKLLLSFPILILIARPVLGQVVVDVRTERPRYLAGEPVFVIVDVRNVGVEAVGYSYCDGDVKLSVRNGQPKTVPNVWGCYGGGVGGGTVCGIDHPPMLKPGDTTSFKYLLRDYRLRPGEYEFHVSGKAGVRWKYYPDYQPGAPPPLPSPHKETDPVDGQMFDRTLPLVVQPSDTEMLQRAFARYVAEAQELDPPRRLQARQAIVEMAPVFLEKTIVAFATDPAVASAAVDALGEINTPESRGDLMKLFDESRDLRLRSSITLALARTGHRDSLAFLASLLPGRSTEPDDLIRRYAAVGIGHIGGDDAVNALRPGPTMSNPLVRDAVAVALGNTKSRLAVPLLISMARSPDGRVENAVCGALSTLTHRTWCDGSADVLAMQNRWRQVWDKHGSAIPIYGPDQCPDRNTTLPLVQ